MGIKNRIDDAQLLWDNNRKEGAFINVLIAVASTARKRYPKPKYTDHESFVKFLCDAYPGKMGAEFRGKLLYVEEIFYSWIRCQLIHESELPPDIEFINDKVNSMTIRAGGKPEYKLLVGYNWIFYL